MARVRKIKPQFWEDVKIGRLSRDARLTYIGLWTFADDCGIITANPIWLKTKLYPYDQIQLQQFKNWFNELERNGFIYLFSYEKEEFIYLPKFSRHQTINRPNYEDLNIPKAVVDSLLQGFSERSVINHVSFSERSVNAHLQEEKEKSAKEKEEKEKIIKKKKNDLPFVPDEYLEAFEEWLNYKRARRETYQTEVGLKKCFTHLLNLCGNNPDIARRIIDQSIANNWAGLFELKQSGKVSVQPRGESVPNGLKLGIGERIENGRRTYGSGRYNIPMDAPPRPREGTYWNESNRQWVTG